MTLGEVAPGGIGAGMYGILVLAIVTVFVAGLMVGRTPEYIGKKIRPTEMKYAALYFLTLPVLILTAAALSIGTKVGQEVIFNPGPLDTRTPLFVGMLVGVILILVGLTYFPALALGPFAEGLH